MSEEEMLKRKYTRPYEKQIAELEHQLTHRNCLDCSNHSSKLRMRTLELEKENEQIKNSDTLCKLIGEQKRKITDLENKLANADYQLEGRDLEIKELEAQIEKMKCCINDLVHLGEFNEYTDEEYFNYQVHEALNNAGQFIKEIKEK